MNNLTKIIISIIILTIIIAVVIVIIVYKKMTRKKHELGNYLSIYFLLLGRSILLRKNFYYSKSNKDFLKNLPTYIKYKYDDIYNNLMYNNITLEILDTYTCKECMWFVYDDIVHTFWLYMKPLVNEILDTALIKSNLKKEVLYPVIHFRCADTPFIKHTHYHFQKYNFYKTALAKINTYMPNPYNKVILLSCNSHKADIIKKDACNIYTDSLSYYLNTINYTTIIECNSSVEDFATLFYAPAVISIGSSYSFMSGFFGMGQFISGGHLNESYIKHDCTSCDNWLITEFDIKHNLIDDYTDTDSVIKICKS